MKQSTGHVCHTWYKYFGLTTKTLYALEIICHWCTERNAQSAYWEKQLW